MLTLYARREPTSDAATMELRRMQPGAFPGVRDVVLYRDTAATVKVGRHSWDSRSKPDRRNRYVALNCYRWRLVWLPEAA